MDGYQIFTDATSDLAPELTAGLPSVEMIPMNVEIGGTEYSYGSRKESQPRSSTACKELGILQRPHKSTQRFILSILNPVCDREPIFCISVFPLVCQVHISLRF